MEILKREVGCLACQQEGLGVVWADYHHAPHPPKGVAGHDWGYPLCPYHHRGMGAGIGPSLAHGKKAFHERYGSDEYLVSVANEALGQFEAMVV